MASSQTRDPTHFTNTERSNSIDFFPHLSTRVSALPYLWERVTNACFAEEGIGNTRPQTKFSTDV